MSNTKAQTKSFKPCSRLGLYPVIESSAWVEKLLPLGVKTIQLRIKERTETLDEEIIKSIALAKRYGALLSINDHWELAIRYGAQAVHLGHEDLDTADLDAIRKAGLFLGLSTHNQEEVDRACSIGPSYIACGPIYATNSKMMPYSPQGIDALNHWRKVLDYPLVAIGGINLGRIPEVMATGVDGVALIAAITQAADPISATRDLLAAVARASADVHV